MTRQIRTAWLLTRFYVLAAWIWLLAKVMRPLEEFAEWRDDYTPQERQHMLLGLLMLCLICAVMVNAIVYIGR